MHWTNKIMLNTIIYQLSFKSGNHLKETYNKKNDYNHDHLFHISHVRQIIAISRDIKINKGRKSAILNLILVKCF